MRRPALTVTLCYLCGLLTGYHLPIPPGVLSAGTVITGLLAVGLRRCAFPLSRVPAWIPSLCICLALTGASAFWYTIRIRVIPQTHLSRYCDRQNPIMIDGVIVRDPDIRVRYTLVTVAADSATIQAKPVPMTGRFLVRLGPDIGPGAYGTRVRVTGRLRSPSPARNPGGFDAQTYYTGRGIYGLMSVRDPTRYRILTQRSQPAFHTTLIRPIKHSIEQTLDSTLQGQSAALIKGILLGQRQQLPEDLLHTFSSIGLTHILAVSGLHVGLITLISMTLFSVVRFPRVYAAISTLAVIGLYACITNLTPSVIRASIMAGLFLVGDLIDRQTDAVNSLAVAALVILILWPQAVFDLSLQLSFIATLAIVVGYPKLKALLPKGIQRSNVWWHRWLRDGLTVSIAAQLGTMPVIAHTFFQVSWIAPVANLFIGPLVFLTTTLGVLTALAGPISLKIARLFSAANWLVLQGMIETSSLFARIPSASIMVPQPPTAVTVAYYLVFLIIIWSPQSRRTRQRLVGLLLVGVIGLGTYLILKPREFVITVLDVGQGDAIFIECPGGYTILVDGGQRTPEFDTGARVIVPFLRSRGNPRIDTIVVSHPHTDHYGGLAAVLSAVPVGEVVECGITPDNPAFRYWIDEITAHKVPYRTISAGDSLHGVGEVHGVFLHPDSVFTSLLPPGGVNNASIVLRLAYHTFSILLAGDIEAEAEHYLIGRYPDLRSTIIKVPHHGSSTSSDQAFLEAIHPRVAIISVGPRNKFRHPSPRIIDRYRNLGIELHRTDYEGGVVIRSDGESFRIEATVQSNKHTWLTPAETLESLLLTGILKGSILRWIG